jgi:hypothetical protein
MRLDKSVKESNLRMKGIGWLDGGLQCGLVLGGWKIVVIRLSEWLFDPYSCFDQWEATLEELRLM